MPWYQTSRPITSVLKSFGIARPTGADPTISDDIGQQFTHDAPGYLGGVEAAGAQRVLVAAGGAGNFSTVIMRTNAPGGCVLRSILFQNNNAPMVVNAGFDPAGLVTPIQATYHWGGRQNEEGPLSPFGRLFVRQQYATPLPTADLHDGTLWSTNDVMMPLGVWIPPVGTFFMIGQTANAIMEFTVFYDLLPYERSADNQS